MTDLKIDYSVLQRNEASLSRLVSEFDNIKAQQNGYDQAMGSSAITSARNAFAGNWDYHRKQLVASMRALGKMISEAHRQFRATDLKLKQGLTSTKK